MIHRHEWRVAQLSADYDLTITTVAPASLNLHEGLFNITPK